MVNPNMAGEDASMDGAIAAIAAKLRGGADVDSQVDTRESREERDPIERQQTTDLEESERLEREAGGQEDGESQAEAETEVAEKAEDEAEAFIELPAAEEGGEAERIPVNEAVEAVKQLRQLNGDIATAVIKAEEEAYTKQDQITQQIAATFKQVADDARVALHLMQQYMPQAPDPIMLDRNSGYYDPEGYHIAKINYDDYVQRYRATEAKVEQANRGLEFTTQHQDREWLARENARTARFIPEFKDEKAREAKKGEILNSLQRYGITKQDLDDIADHKAWRIMNDLAKYVSAEKKAPEVKKHLTETKPKIVNGRVSQARDPQNGRFMDGARKELKKDGSEGAFAKYLMRTGALKDLL